MRDLLPEYIKTYVSFQEMPLVMSAEIDLFLLENEDMTSDTEETIEETRSFLADRYNTLQDEIDKWKAAQVSGSKVLLMSDEERDGWDARVEAEELERASKNVRR